MCVTANCKLQPSKATNHMQLHTLPPPLYLVTHLVELVSSSQTCWPTANDGHTATSADLLMRWWGLVVVLIVRGKQGGA